MDRPTVLKMTDNFGGGIGGGCDRGYDPAC